MSMKNTSRKLFIISFILSALFSLLFILAAINKSGVGNFDIYLGAIWVFILSFIVVLSLVHILKGVEVTERIEGGDNEIK